MKKILIVDDTETNRMLLGRILCAEYEVLEAANGIEALAVLASLDDMVSAVLLDIVMPKMDGFETLSRIRDSAILADIPVLMVTASDDVETEIRALAAGANDFIVKPFKPEVIKHRLRNTIRLRETTTIAEESVKDKLTGLLNREAFFEQTTYLTASHEAGYYALICFDIDSFKVINDRSGTAYGDEILRSLASVIHDFFHGIEGISCRISADNFAALYPNALVTAEQFENFFRSISKLEEFDERLKFSIGRYIIDDISLSANSMYDRAMMAKTTNKGRYDKLVITYDHSMFERVRREQQIRNDMNAALLEGQFQIWLQPQYNHSAKALIGAEALVRWHHPDYDKPILPNEFIPVFEQNGFVFEMDKDIWRQACSLLKTWIDAGKAIVPLSVNVSRFDMLAEDFFETITGLVKIYDIPINLLRLEITESAFSKDAGQIIAITNKLIDFGFTVEIDDFGSGYSSLNVLKDVHADILKLDMRFLEGGDDSTRGGSILESVVRMAKWLGMPVIAEGVETLQQADYLKSIGCYYIQGYLYARPMPVSEFESILDDDTPLESMETLTTIDALDTRAFWNPDSMETLIFNSFVGGACIMDFHDESVEILRINDKYTRELGFADLPDKYLLNRNPDTYIDESELSLLYDIIHRAIDTNDECDGEFRIRNLAETGKYTHVRATMRVIARASDRFLLYCTVLNITELREAERKLKELGTQLSVVAQNVNAGISVATLTDGDIEYLFVNDAYYELFGYTKAQFEKELPYGLFDLVDAKNLRIIGDAVEELTRTGEPNRIDFDARTRNGLTVTLRCNSSLCNLEGVSEPVYVAVLFDMTNEKKTAELLRISEEQYRIALAHSDRIIARYDIASRVLHVTDEAAALFGEPTELVDVPYDQVARGHIAPESAEDYIAFYEGILDGNETGRTILKRTNANGWVWLEACYTTIKDDADVPVTAVVSFVDVTKNILRDRAHQAALENERILRDQIRLDGATGLYNKAATETLIAERLALIDDAPCTFMIVDIDNLKTLNDTFGHPQGDRAIHLIAETLKTQFRRTDIIGRVGGDEFVIFLDGIGDTAILEDILNSFFTKLKELRIGRNDEEPLCASIGIVIGKTGMSTFEELYSKADKALYHGKWRGKNQFTFYSD